MAIVLVIIGLLLGLLLKGQGLVNNAKVKSYASDFRNIPVMINSYQDRFKALPGDDVQITTHLPGATLATTPVGMVGNGVINGSWDSATSSDETCLFWQHVRLAGLVSGSTVVDCTLGADYAPRNANGGRVGIQSNTGFNTLTGAMEGSYIICSSNIPGEFVLQIDAVLDNGDPQTGSVRAIRASSVGGASDSIASVQNNPADSFIVCMSI
jgi:hypothetical protein